MNNRCGLLAPSRGRSARWGGSTVNEDRRHGGDACAGTRVAAAAGGVLLALPARRHHLGGRGAARHDGRAAIPLVQRSIIDNVIVTHHQSIWPLAGLLLVAAAVNFGSIYLRRFYGGRLSLDVQHDLRTELFGSLSRLDGARQDEIRTGQMVGRSISDLNMVQGLLAMAPITFGNMVLFVDLPRHHGHPVAAAHRRDRSAASPGAIAHRAGVPAQAVSGHLVRAAAGRPRWPAWSRRPSPACAW